MSFNQGLSSKSKSGVRGITPVEYDKLVLEEDRKEASWLEELGSHTKAYSDYLITASHLLELVRRAEELFDVSQAGQKRKLWKFILANAKMEGEKLVFVLKRPCASLMLDNKTKNWLTQFDAIRTVLLAGVV